MSDSVVELDPKAARRLEALQFLLQDLEAYSTHCLKIKPKVGPLVPLIFNRAQLYAHEKIEDQLRRTGMVRQIVLKGRQQGLSTYVAARFYKRTSTSRAVNAFIVAHEQKATNNLYGIVRRYHQHNPLAPSTGATNAQELVFDILDSGYKLATAGSQDVGRSNTVQLMHASEFGFWQNAATHMAGIGNTIALLPGTEIIVESTANGMGNPFHEMWQSAETGEGVYEPLFIPWFWQPEYAVEVPKKFELSDDDLRYMRAYKLTPQQMAFRRMKQIEYGSEKIWLFDQEYPAMPALAFQTGTTNPLINPNSVQAAANMINDMRPDTSGVYVVGVDPAEEGMDRTAIVHRKGRSVVRVEYHSKKSPMQVAGMIADIWKDRRPDAIFLDKIGLGSGILSRCHELNIPVIGVNSAMKPHNTELFENKRAEMWWTMRDWIEDSPCWLPNDMALISDLCAPMPDLSSNGKRLLEKKEKMRKRGVRSPDGGDALALTFAERIEPRYLSEMRGAASPTDLPATNAGY